MLDGEPVVGRAQGVSAGMGNALPHEIGHKLKNIVPQTRYFAVLGFSYIPGKHMDFALVIRKEGRNFFADKNLRQMGYFQRATDGVVICDGDVVHASGPGNVVYLAGRGITFAAAYFLQNPLRRAC